jgi:hypothetical protein
VPVAVHDFHVPLLFLYVLSDVADVDNNGLVDGLAITATSAVLMLMYGSGMQDCNDGGSRGVSPALIGARTAVFGDMDADGDRGLCAYLCWCAPFLLLVRMQGEEGVFVDKWG